MESSPRLIQVVRRPQEVRTAGPRIEGARRIAIVRDDRLGDVVVTLPAVSAIRRAYPEIELALVVRSPLAPLAACVAGVHGVIGVGSEGAGAGQVRAALARYAPDVVIVISRGRQAAWGAARAGVPLRIGTGRRWFSPCFNRTVVESRRRSERHEAEYALGYAHRAGAPGAEAEFGLEIPSRFDEIASRVLQSLKVAVPFVVLHPGSGGSCPAWPIADHLALGDRLRTEGIDVVLSVGPQDAAVEGEIAASRGPAPIAVYRGDDPVLLGAVVRRASLVVGSSTGPVHLAAALGAPTLALHAPHRSCGPGRWGPYAANGWALVARRSRGGRLEGLPVDLVARAVIDLVGQPFQGG